MNPTYVSFLAQLFLISVIVTKTTSQPTFMSAWACHVQWLSILIFNKETLKGKFPQTTMWIGWAESNFRNPTVKFWANLDNPFTRTNYAKFCMHVALSRRNSARICDIIREQLSIVTSQILTHCHLRGWQVAYKKLTETLKNHSSWLDI